MANGRTLSRIIRGIAYFPKTLWINMKILPLREAIRLPIIVMGHCSFRGIKRGNLLIDAPVKPSMIHIAAQKSSKRGVGTNSRAAILIDQGGKIVFHGRASIGAGSSLCAHGGSIDLGDRFSCNVNCFLYSSIGISCGKDVLLGWNVSIRDNDGHPIYDAEGRQLNKDQEIKIGDHTWIASHADILKGVHLAEGTIAGTRSVVTRSVEQKNCIIAGVPARVIKQNVHWNHNLTSDD